MRGLHAKFPDRENKESVILNKTLSIKVMNIHIINTKLKSYCENLKRHASCTTCFKKISSQKSKNEIPSFWKRVSNFRLRGFQDSGLLNFKEREVTALPQMTTSGKIVN